MVELIAEIIFGEFVSIIRESVTDVAKDKLAKNTHSNFNTKIYTIIINALNEMTFGSLKYDIDKLNTVAEGILKSFSGDISNLEESIGDILKNSLPQVNKDAYNLLKNEIYHQLSKNGNEELYREIMLQIVWQPKEDLSSEILIEIKNRLDIMDKKLFGSQQENPAQIDDKKFKANKKDYYIEKWNGNLFLQDEDDIITLADAFIMPDCDIYSYNTGNNYLFSDVLEQIVVSFINYPKTCTFLITGVPGIGKTTFVSWLANKYKDYENFMFLRFRDWGKCDLENGILDAIYKSLSCNKNDLEKMIIVIDGFDENKALNKSDSLLSDLLNEIKDFDNIKIIITSRPAYIKSYNFDNSIKILPFDRIKIDKFYCTITKKKLLGKIDVYNKAVYGIPVILYMAIKTEIDITKKATKSELYNKVFAENGGIFDKFYYKGKEYDSGVQILRNNQNINIYIEFLQDIAFIMFEKNDLTLTSNEYILPKLTLYGESINILDFPVNFLFEEGCYNIEFIHKSIYEYFVAEYIFKKVFKTILSKKKLAGILGNLFKTSRLTNEVIEFLKYKISKSKIISIESIVNVFNIMLENGMLFYTEKCYRNGVQCEINIFLNMLDIIYIWNFKKLQVSKCIGLYISISCQLRLNLNNLVLNGVDLANINLKMSNFSEAYLNDAKLNGTDFGLSNFNGAYLIGANLTGANLTGAKFRGAYLIGAKLIGAVFFGADLWCTIFDNENINKIDETQCDLSHSKVYIKKEERIVSYEEYLQWLEHSGDV